MALVFGGSPAALFLFAAFTALSFVRRSPSKPFCDSTRRKQEVEDCVPCPGKCREGKLIGCKTGYVLKGNSVCELDVLFRNKVDILKQDLIARNLIGTNVTVDVLRKDWEGGEPKVFDLAFEELLEERELQVGNGGLIVPIREEPREEEMPGESGSPVNAALFFLIFVLVALFLRYREKRELRRRQTRPNFVDPRHFLGGLPASEGPSENASGSGSTSNNVADQVPPAATAGSMVNSEGPVSGTSTAASQQPVSTRTVVNAATNTTTAAIQASESSVTPLALNGQPSQGASLESRGGEVEPPKSQSTINSAVPYCVICTVNTATEALIPCGHLVACSQCVQSYIEHMDRNGDYRCPQCRQESYGQWLHIHGLASS